MNLRYAYQYIFCFITNKVLIYKLTYLYVKIKEINYKYKAMENKFLSEIEVSKGSKRLLQKEVEMLMNSLVRKNSKLYFI